VELIGLVVIVRGVLTVNLEKIKAKILWVSGYYDGPIDGAPVKKKWMNFLNEN
jgi:hypothetical protein